MEKAGRGTSSRERVREKEKERDKQMMPHAQGVIAPGVQKVFPQVQVWSMTPGASSPPPASASVSTSLLGGRREREKDKGGASPSTVTSPSPSLKVDAVVFEGDLQAFCTPDGKQKLMAFGGTRLNIRKYTCAACIKNSFFLDPKTESTADPPYIVALPVDALEDEVADFEAIFRVEGLLRHSIHRGTHAERGALAGGDAHTLISAATVDASAPSPPARVKTTPVRFSTGNGPRSRGAVPSQGGRSSVRAGGSCLRPPSVSLPRGVGGRERDRKEQKARGGVHKEKEKERSTPHPIIPQAQTPPSQVERPKRNQAAAERGSLGGREREGIDLVPESEEKSSVFSFGNRVARKEAPHQRDSGGRQLEGEDPDLDVEVPSSAASPRDPISSTTSSTERHQYSLSGGQQQRENLMVVRGVGAGARGERDPTPHPFAQQQHQDQDQTRGLPPSLAGGVGVYRSSPSPSSSAAAAGVPSPSPSLCGEKETDRERETDGRERLGGEGGTSGSSWLHLGERSTEEMIVERQSEDERMRERESASGIRLLRLEKSLKLRQGEVAELSRRLEAAQKRQETAESEAAEMKAKAEEADAVAAAADVEMQDWRARAEAESAILDEFRETDTVVRTLRSQWAFDVTRNNHRRFGLKKPYALEVVDRYLESIGRPIPGGRVEASVEGEGQEDGEGGEGGEGECVESQVQQEQKEQPEVQEEEQKKQMQPEKEGTENLDTAPVKVEGERDGDQGEEEKESTAAACVSHEGQVLPSQSPPNNNSAGSSSMVMIRRQTLSHERQLKAEREKHSIQLMQLEAQIRALEGRLEEKNEEVKDLRNSLSEAATEIHSFELLRDAPFLSQHLNLFGRWVHTRTAASQQQQNQGDCSREAEGQLEGRQTPELGLGGLRTEAKPTNKKEKKEGQAQVQRKPTPVPLSHETKEKENDAPKPPPHPRHSPRSPTPMPPSPPLPPTSASASASPYTASASAVATGGSLAGGARADTLPRTPIPHPPPLPNRAMSPKDPNPNVAPSVPLLASPRHDSRRERHVPPPESHRRKDEKKKGSPVESAAHPKVPVDAPAEEEKKIQPIRPPLAVVTSPRPAVTPRGFTHAQLKSPPMYAPLPPHSHRGNPAGGTMHPLNPAQTPNRHHTPGPPNPATPLQPTQAAVHAHAQVMRAQRDSVLSHSSANTDNNNNNNNKAAHTPGGAIGASGPHYPYPPPPHPHYLYTQGPHPHPLPHHNHLQLPPPAVPPAASAGPSPIFEQIPPTHAWPPNMGFLPTARVEGMMPVHCPLGVPPQHHVHQTPHTPRQMGAALPPSSALDPYANPLAGCFLHLPADHQQTLPGALQRNGNSSTAEKQAVQMGHGPPHAHSNKPTDSADRGRGGFIARLFNPR
uniref:Uncharacterized protein n=1 Tax=Chromera velia CCMP2878 TaxID=1169474 RepID=A0A0G4GA46_9ALVE|eukprot:Cvel_4397.t1-p1 / transcript=Cvel_4397.t1 / gene=Cvel_4397 / organism=Chromera_velia_CCMP2878 / gene_product=hypothetical protein / transcript_product=hypothetical protein / location=Cvel_scaffold191:36248-42388(-) / protein_length=1378 / sequence_SO=supercontig / SO=protein_coding / is_pseudo=false